MCLQLAPSQVSPVWKYSRAEGVQGQHLNRRPLTTPLWLLGMRGIRKKGRGIVQSLKSLVNLIKESEKW